METNAALLSGIYRHRICAAKSGILYRDDMGDVRILAEEATKSAGVVLFLHGRAGVLRTLDLFSALPGATQLDCASDCSTVLSHAPLLGCTLARGFARD